jgi:hypothetical protein
MDRSPEEELAKLGEKLRKTLSMRAQSESMMTDDVNRGMSHKATSYMQYCMIL